MRRGQTAKMAASNGVGMEVDATGEKFTRERRSTLLINYRLASVTLIKTHDRLTEITDLPDRPVKLAQLLTGWRRLGLGFDWTTTLISPASLADSLLWLAAFASVTKICCFFFDNNHWNRLLITNKHFRANVDVSWSEDQCNSSVLVSLKCVKWLSVCHT